MHNQPINRKFCISVPSSLVHYLNCLFITINFDYAAASVSPNKSSNLIGCLVTDMSMIFYTTLALLGYMISSESSESSSVWVVHVTDSCVLTTYLV